MDKLETSTVLSQWLYLNASQDMYLFILDKQVSRTIWIRENFMKLFGFHSCSRQNPIMFRGTAKTRFLSFTVIEPPHFQAFSVDSHVVTWRRAYISSFQQVTL